MERVREVTRPAAGVAALALCLAAGCIHVHTDADGKVKSVELKAGSPAEDAAKADGGVKQASATVPAGFGLPSLPKMPSFGPTAGPPTVMVAMFDPGTAALPDPTRNDAPTHGLVGRLFFYGAGTGMPAARPDGPVTVTMTDESSGKPADAPIGSWTFDKVTLGRLHSLHPQLGACYQVFLPWPDYRPGAVTKVRLTVKYNPEAGPALIAPPATVSLDTTPAVSSPGSVTVGGGPPGGLPGAGFGPPGGGMPQQQQQFGGFGLPAGGPVAPSGGPPAGLPPIAYTAPKR